MKQALVQPLVVNNADQTPEESLEYAYQKLHSELSKELLDIVKSCTPVFFERLIIDLLITMGYGGSRKEAGQAMGKSGDGGIDGIINLIVARKQKYSPSTPASIEIAG